MYQLFPLKLKRCPITVSGSVNQLAFTPLPSAAS